MKFCLEREQLLQPLQAVQGVVERRQTLPILSNVLLSARDGQLAVTGTDMEVELVATVPSEDQTDGEITIPARKLIDICRSLPGGAKVTFELEEQRATLRSGRSRFTLSTLPAAEYPNTDEPSESLTLTLRQGDLRRLIDLTQFAMAHQDVRYYLNGLLVEIGKDYVRAIATDGHRLAVSQRSLPAPIDTEVRQIILPRKAVGELHRVLGTGDEDVALCIGSNGVRVRMPGLQLTSKLIDGRFPDYERVIPDKERCDKIIDFEADELRSSLARASILSNEKYRAIRLSFDDKLLRIVASNPEQEEAEEELEIEYDGEALEIGFNVSYLLDALGALPSDTARVFLSDNSNCCLIEPVPEGDCQFVVMPMRL